MSLPRSPPTGIIRGPRGGLNPRPKPVLRAIHLDLPPELQVSGSPPPPPPPTQTQFSLPSTPIYNAPNLPSISQMPRQNKGFTFYAPSLFYSFPQPSPQPQFIFEALLPSSSYSFNVQPDPSMSRPRFLIYLVPCNPSLPPFPVQFKLNNCSYDRMCGDGIPIDATDNLMLFGRHNIISFQRSNLPTSFLFVGVWANFCTLEELINQIGSNSPFVSPVCLDFCPISKAPITYPARGKSCQHTQCFDAGNYITYAQATGDWICPICNVPLPIFDLMIDLSRQMPTITPDQEFEPVHDSSFGFKTAQDDSWNAPPVDEDDFTSFFQN